MTGLLWSSVSRWLVFYGLLLVDGWSSMVFCKSMAGLLWSSVSKSMAGLLWSSVSRWLVFYGLLRSFLQSMVKIVELGGLRTDMEN